MDSKLKTMYSKCLVNPFWEDKAVTDKMIALHNDFKAMPSAEIFRYIILMYDKNSQLRQDYINMVDRKHRAAELAGFTKTKSGKYSERYESVMLGQDDTANIQIVRYILQFNENDYLSLCAYTELLVAETIDSMKAQDASDRQKIVGNIKNITAELRAIEERMLGQDNYKKMRDALYASIDKNRLQLRPEQVAKVLTEKKLPFELDKNNNLKPLDEDVLSFA